MGRRARARCGRGVASGCEVRRNSTQYAHQEKRTPSAASSCAQSGAAMARTRAAPQAAVCPRATRSEERLDWTRCTGFALRNSLPPRAVRITGDADEPERVMTSIVLAGFEGIEQARCFVLRHAQSRGSRVRRDRRSSRPRLRRPVCRCRRSWTQPPPATIASPKTCCRQPTRHVAALRAACAASHASPAGCAGPEHPHSHAGMGARLRGEWPAARCGPGGAISVAALHGFAHLRHRLGSWCVPTRVRRRHCCELSRAALQRSGTS